MTRDEEHSRPVLGNDLNQCLMCKHLVTVGIHFNSGGTGWRCAAFGERDIPDVIVMGFFDHREEFVGLTSGYSDNGIQFEDANEGPYTYEDLAGPLKEDDDDEADEEDGDEEEDDEEED